MSRSNVTRYGLISRIEIDYDSYPISREEVAKNIIQHYREIYRYHNTDPRYDAFIESYDERIGAPFAWPELHFQRAENLN